MAYRLKHSESVPEGIQRIAREEIRSAVQHLRGKGVRSHDEAIHEVRKSIKKMRALLRLVQPELGSVLFADENMRFRDAGRKLREVRDAAALVTAFDDLKSRCKKSLGNGSLSRVRRGLVVHKQHVEEEAKVPALLASLASALGHGLQSTKHWPLETDGFPAVRQGLEKTFRAERRRLRKPRSTEAAKIFTSGANASKIIGIMSACLRICGLTCSRVTSKA